MNDKPKSTVSAKSALRLNKETLRNLNVRSGIQTGRSDAACGGSIIYTYACTVSCGACDNNRTAVNCANPG